jgi:hypothetical protein
LREALHPGPAGPPGPEVAAGLVGLGDDLAACLFPQGIVEALCRPALQGSLLTLETNELGLPWELARLQGRWLWERFVVARREIRRGMARLEAGPAWPSSRALLLADPEESLPAARREAGEIARILEERGWEVETLTGPRATARALIERLQAGPVALLHLACVADYDPDNPADSCLYLADEPFPAARMADVRFPAPPRLVFLNACQSGRQELSSPLLARPSGLAGAFLDAGAELVVAPLWDVSDRLSARLVAGAYAAFAAGAPFGAALQQERRNLLEEDDPWATVHAYVLYGDASMTREAPEAATATWLPRIHHRLAILSGAEAGSSIPLLPSPGRRLLLGAAGQRINDIEFDDPAMANDEGWLEFVAGTFHFVRGSDRVPLRPGHLLHLGGTTLRYEESAPRPACYLEVLAGPEKGGRFPLEAETVTLGRRADCTVRLSDPAVSRLHCSLTREEEGFVLVPREGRPVAVNGVVSSRRRRLRHGDEVRLSERTLLRYAEARREP